MNYCYCSGMAEEVKTADAPTTHRCAPTRPNRPAQSPRIRPPAVHRARLRRNHRRRRRRRTPASPRRPSTSPSAANAACSKGSWTSPDRTSPPPTTNSGGRWSPPPRRRRATRQERRVQLPASWPAPDPSTPSSVAQPTRKRSPPSSAGDCSTNGSPTRPNASDATSADDLKPGLTVTEAGQRYCALASPELYNVLTVEFGWTAEQHRDWLTTCSPSNYLADTSPASTPPPAR